MGIEVLADEADKKRAELRDRMRKGQLDKTRLLNPSPAFRYKFLNAKDRAVSHATHDLGFETVKKDDECRPAHGSWDEAIGAYRLGDLILAKEPIDIFEMKREIANEKMDRAQAQLMDDTREKVNKLARDEGRAPAHTDVFFDDSKQGPDEIRVKPRKG